MKIQTYKMNEYVLKILDISEEEVEKLSSIGISHINCPFLAEKILIMRTYYDFLENKSCMKKLEGIISIIDETQNEMSQYYKLTMGIIILRSFLDKTMYDVKEKFILSDIIFQNITDNYQKFLVIEGFYTSPKQIQTTVLHILDIMIEKKITSEKKINMWSPKFKTLKYYSLDVEYTNNFNSFFSFSLNEYSAIQYGSYFYISSTHYSKTFRLDKENFSSKKSFKVKDVGYIMRKANLKLYVDEVYQDILKIKLKGEVGVILNSIKEKNELLSLHYEKELWTSETKQEISNLQREMSEEYSRILELKFAYYDFNNKGIIFPLSLDFRGRKYYYSSISPTNSKILRLSFHYGWYKEGEIENLEQIFSKDFSEQIVNFCEKNNLKKTKNLFDMYFWLLIGIGKEVMNKEEYPISAKQIISLGMKYYQIDENKLPENLDKYLEIKHYKNCISSISEKKVMKRCIIKDATASVNQIFMKKLGPINQQSLNIVNLGNEWSWNDTYLWYRDMFYKDVIKNGELGDKISEKDLKKIMSRKNIKNTVMTIPYSAGFDLCWKNYLEKLGNVDMPYLIIKKIFKAFYKYVKHTFQEKYLYMRKSETLIQKMNEQFEKEREYILNSETGDADISYFKMKRGSIDKKYMLDGKSKRITKHLLIPSKAIDITSFNIASGANLIHFLDAEEIRIIEKVLGFSLTTIHDSYLIDIANCSKLVEEKIRIYQKTINKFTTKYKINNIFIIL